MWKKDDQSDPTPTQSRSESATPRTEPYRSVRGTGERATIGPSITIRGEVSGDEDLLVQGRVDGSVDLKENSVTVGQEGQVKADIKARVITVEGKVEGNLNADEQVILRSSARVQGDIKAPRVVLEDGASFRGGVDMGDVSGSERRPASSRPTETRKAPEPTTTSTSASSGTEKGETEKSGATT